MSVTRIAYEADGWGVGELWLEDDVVVWHELPHPRVDVESSRHPLARLMASYFAGRRVSFDEVQLDLEWFTPFQRAVADALRRVPYGETVTYGELAALAGAPGAARAAGTFCARNRLGLFVPCHRVVGAGGLGSYGSLGLEYKKRLLRLEGVPIP